MDSFQEKLNKIDQIDNLVTSINAKVVRLEQGTKCLDARLEQVEKCTQLISDNYDKQKTEIKEQKTDLKELRKEVNNISKSLDKNAKDVSKFENELHASLEDIKRDSAQFKEHIIDVELKTMSNNLIFYNLPENEDENCVDVITKFCKDTMKLENAEQLRLSDAHRLGKIGPNTRPILVKFISFEHRELVRRNAKNLKGSAFGISEQLPIEIQNRRKKLLPRMKELRDREIKAYFVRDKIYVSGKEYKP